jgi:hypothetical protein
MQSVKMIINDFGKEDYEVQLNKSLRYDIIKLPALLVACNTLDSYSGGDRAGNRLFCLRFLMVFSVPPGKFCGSTSVRPCHSSSC